MAISSLTNEKAGENRSSVFEWMKRRDYLALVFILAARLNVAIDWVSKRKPDVLVAGLFHSAFESQFRRPETPLSHGLTGLITINSIAK